MKISLLAVALLAASLNFYGVNAEDFDDDFIDDDLGDWDGGFDDDWDADLDMMEFCPDDWTEDTCAWPMDNLCDAHVYCHSDCYDCDPCKEHNYDCNGCVEAGCFWCPGDAICSGAALEINFFDMHNKVSSCNAVEDWKETCEAVGENNAYTDPLYDASTWAFDLMNLEAAWKMGYTGKGVHVRVNDDGVDSNHPEFVNKFDVEHSCEEYYPTNETDSHGTACASIILAEGDNDVCSVGVAPGANLSACITTLNDTAFFIQHWEVVDISSNSWGPDSCTPAIYRSRHLQESCPFDPNAEESPCVDCEGDIMSEECKNATVAYCSTASNFENDRLACAEYFDLYIDCQYADNFWDPMTGETMSQLVTRGRGGLGTILVFASGNNHENGENTNFDPYVSSRYTIGVAAVDKSGRHASYSNPGASVLVSAPGGDEEDITKNIVANIFGGCTDSLEGTSFAAPQVAGVTALMLEARPQLGWRDVQGILALTARQVYEEDETWVTNGAGLTHSEKYGFGIVDAAAAVNASIGWDIFGPELMFVAESGDIDLVISNDETMTTTHSLSVDAPTLVTGSVVIYVNLVHASRGDLQVELTSPSGTVSILHPSDRPEFTNLRGERHWKLVTVKNWYEDPTGDWTLSITDQDAQSVPVCLDKPFNGTIVQDGEERVFTCQLLDEYRLCHDNGTMVEYFADQLDEENEAGSLDSCCGCGGGEDWEGENFLFDWTLVVYGHEGVPPVEIQK